MNDFSTPAGWYPDGDGWERRWDGNAWTDERRRKAEPTQVRQQSNDVAPTAVPGQPAQPGQPGQPGQGPSFPGAPTAPPPAQAPAGPPPSAPPGYGHVPSQPGPGSWPTPGSWPNSGQGPSGQGQGPGQPWGQPSYGTPAGGPRKSRLGLWLTLAAVLVLVAGVGITLAVLQPWSGGGGSGDDPTDEPATAAVQGDINGDGYGDARFYFYLDYDKVTRVEALSNGNGFETRETAVDPYREPNEIFLDWDGDGANDHLAWKFVASGKQVTLTSSDDAFPEDQTFTLSLSTLKEYGDAEIQLAHGDFDGDGDQDLVIASPNDRNVDVSVLTNDGKGTFSAPRLWLSMPNAVIDVVRLHPGDFDGDGDTDLWVQLPAERVSDKDYGGYYSGDRGYALLTSTGKGFDAGAVNKPGVYLDALRAGDVTGDGKTYLIGVRTNSSTGIIDVNAYDVSRGRLEEVAGFTGSSKIGSRTLQGAVLSDVTGDGKADLVFVVKAFGESKFTGVQVMTSTGSGFESALVWTDTPVCEDDDCRIEFIGVPRY